MQVKPVGRITSAQKLNKRLTQKNGDLNMASKYYDLAKTFV